ncbi:MAG: translation initiation factor IF-2, partial [Treponema sp.]|nr:translation initiation factor IF-2 [Treponema sp.]
MAEELDSAQRPKAELIKRQKGESESPAGSKNAADGGGKSASERTRKVIVIKKKAPAAPAAGPVKKPQTKVVVTKSDGVRVSPDARVSPDVTRLSQDAANRESVSREAAKTAGGEQDAAVKPDSAPAADAETRPVKKPAEEGGAPRPAGEQRKAV